MESDKRLFSTWLARAPVLARAGVAFSRSVLVPSIQEILL